MKAPKMESKKEKIMEVNQASEQFPLPTSEVMFPSLQGVEKGREEEKKEKKKNVIKVKGKET